jgi:hypothetical protein
VARPTEVDVRSSYTLFGADDVEHAAREPTSVDGGSVRRRHRGVAFDECSITR